MTSVTRLRNWILPLLVVLIGINICIQLWNIGNHKKVAFVRSHDLIYNYNGMKEAQHVFNKQKERWQANLDTLELTFKISLNQFQKDVASMTESEKRQRERLLAVQQNNISQYQSQIQEKAETQEAELMDGVLSQVNTFIQNYAEKHGYDIVFGTTLSGSVLYGKDALDITKNIEEALNQHYTNGE